MSFSELDPLEKLMKKRVQDMTPGDLISYITTYMKEVHEVKLVTDPSVPKERAVFRGLQKTYGQDAGLIVKWVFWKYQGKYDGKLINFLSFQKACKWWTDIMYTELQEQLKRESEVKPKEKQWSGFAREL